MVVVEKLVVEETCKLSVGDQDALKSRVLKLCQMVFSCTFIYDACHDPNRPRHLQNTVVREHKHDTNSQALAENEPAGETGIKTVSLVYSLA